MGMLVIMGMGMFVIVIVGMFVIVGVIIVVMMSGCRNHRAEDLECFLVGDFVSLHHLADRKVVFNKQIRFGKLGGKMEVAHLPCALCGFLLATWIGNPKNFLGLLLDDVGFPVFLKKTIPMGKRRIEIKPEIASVIGFSAPPPLGQNASFDF